MFFRVVSVVLIISVSYIVGSPNDQYNGPERSGKTYIMQIVPVEYGYPDMGLERCTDMTNHYRNVVVHLEKEKSQGCHTAVEYCCSNHVRCFYDASSLYYYQLMYNNLLPAYMISKTTVIKLRIILYPYEPDQTGNLEWDCAVSDYEQSTVNKISVGTYLEHVYTVKVFGREYIGSRGNNKWCPPGTWMTCQGDPGCYFEYPYQDSTGGITWTKKGDIFTTKMDDVVPVNKCYPCENAILKVHYQNSQITCGYAVPTVPAYCYTNDGKAAPWPCRDFIQETSCKQTRTSFASVDKLFCPGFWFAPLYCPDGWTASADRSKCVCDDGTYADSSNVCVKCPIGYFCKQGNKMECPDGQYQDKIGQNYCSGCSSALGEPMTTCPRDFKMALCTAKNGNYYKEAMRCVPCTQCRNPIIIEASANAPGIAPISNYVDCYS